jgi:4-hydroxythreonine-4-phosphate dehydrogenase
MNDRSPMRIGISVGDTNGIGLEVVLKALSDRQAYADCSAIIYASEGLLKQNLDLLDIEFSEILSLGAGQEPEKGQVYIKEIWSEAVEFNPGAPSASSGQLSFESLEAVVEDLKSGQLDAMVTAPIDKKNIQGKDFYFPGHTEYLASKVDSDKVLMLLISGALRVGVVTGHIPISKVATHITSELIQEKSRMMHHSLVHDFGLAKPRIAVFGLNPHAGDGGLLGSEEEHIIQPAIAALQALGIEAQGPFPADGFFGSSVYTKYDAILAMYHDQGLVPFKALSFGSGVNFTAGLSIVRTSPDHGTAFDIAGKNKADGSSFAAAIRCAIDIVSNRRE